MSISRYPLYRPNLVLPQNPFSSRLFSRLNCVSDRSKSIDLILVVTYILLAGHVVAQGSVTGVFQKDFWNSNYGDLVGTSENRTLSEQFAAASNLRKSSKHQLYPELSSQDFCQTNSTTDRFRFRLLLRGLNVSLKGDVVHVSFEPESSTTHVHATLKEPYRSRFYINTNASWLDDYSFKNEIAKMSSISPRSTNGLDENVLRRVGSTQKFAVRESPFNIAIDGSDNKLKVTSANLRSFVPFTLQLNDSMPATQRDNLRWSRRGLARLNSDGTLDTAFDSNVSSSVFGLEIQADGKILIGGFFSGVGKFHAVE